MIHEHLYDGIENLSEQIEILNNKIQKIESVLGPYLKPSTRKYLDKLEQRFKCIEFSVNNILIK